MGKLLTPDDMTTKVPGTTKGYWAQRRFLGTGPSFLKISPKVVLYDETTVDEWLQASVRTQTGEPVSAQ